MSDSFCDPMDCRLLCLWDFPGKNTGGGGVAISPPEDLPDPGVKPTSLCLQHFAGGFFTTEPPGKSLDLGTGD